MAASRRRSRASKNNSSSEGSKSTRVPASNSMMECSDEGRRTRVACTTSKINERKKKGDGSTGSDDALRDCTITGKEKKVEIVSTKHKASGNRQSWFFFFFKGIFFQLSPVCIFHLISSHLRTFFLIVYYVRSTEDSLSVTLPSMLMSCHVLTVPRCFLVKKTSIGIVCTTRLRHCPCGEDPTSR